MTDQTITMDASRAEKVRDRLHYTFQTDGMSARTFLDTLAVVIEERLWEDIDGIDTFRDLCDAPFPPGLDVGSDRIVKLVDTLRHPQEGTQKVDDRMQWLRENVRRLVLDDVVPARPVGRSTSNVRSTNIARTDDVDYVLARLKRDAPQLADRVIAGELSPNAAAVEAGIRPERVSVRLDDMERAAAALRRRLTDEQRQELVELLQG